MNDNGCVFVCACGVCVYLCVRERARAHVCACVHVCVLCVCD